MCDIVFSSLCPVTIVLVSISLNESRYDGAQSMDISKTGTDIAQRIIQKFQKTAIDATKFKGTHGQKTNTKNTQP